MMEGTESAVEAISITLSITKLWWESATLIRKNHPLIVLSEDNKEEFLKAVEVDDIFHGVTKDGAHIEGSVTSKAGSSITLSRNVSIS